MTEEAVYLFDNKKELIDTISPENTTVNEQEAELNGLINHFVEGKYEKSIDDSHFFGVVDVDDENNFHMYKADTKTATDGSFSLSGTHIFFDDLSGRGGVMRDRRPQNESVNAILPSILAGTGWEVGQVQTSNTGTSSYYYVSKLEAFWDFIEKWRVEFELRITFSKGKIVRKQIDIYNQLSDDYGKWYEYGDKLLTVTKEQSLSNIYTAFIGRGKGEEATADTGEKTGGYGRRISFEDVEWSVDNGDPVDKPLGQDYVEIPKATELYGYEDGTPRFTVVEFQDIEEPEALLESTYNHATEASRPKVQFKSNVIENGVAEKGETVTIIRDDMGIRYKTRIFKITRNFKNKKVKSIEFGDKLVQSTAQRNKAIENSIKESERQNIEWLNSLRQTIVDDYFNDDGYNYDLRAGNEYDLPGGYYSFDRPIDEAPTKVIYMGAGRILIANSKTPNGEWEWRTAATGDGFVADEVNTGILNADLVRIISEDANITIDRNGFLASHDDGTSTSMSPDGFRRHTPSDNRNYHYLIWATTFVYGDSSSNARWIQLPDDFKGKNFQVFLAIADSLNAPDYTYSIQRFVTTGHPRHSIDYANARVPIIAYKSETHMDGNEPLIRDVQGMILAIY